MKRSETLQGRMTRKQLVEPVHQSEKQKKNGRQREIRCHRHQSRKYCIARALRYNANWSLLPRASSRPHRGFRLCTTYQIFSDFRTREIQSEFHVYTKGLQTQIFTTMLLTISVTVVHHKLMNDFSNCCTHQHLDFSCTLLIRQNFGVLYATNDIARRQSSATEV